MQSSRPRPKISNPKFPHKKFFPNHPHHKQPPPQVGPPPGQKPNFAGHFHRGRAHFSETRQTPPPPSAWRAGARWRRLARHRLTRSVAVIALAPTGGRPPACLASFVTGSFVTGAGRAGQDCRDQCFWPQCRHITGRVRVYGVPRGLEAKKATCAIGI
jgi:hypothetical protein